MRVHGRQRWMRGHFEKRVMCIHGGHGAVREKRGDREERGARHVAKREKMGMAR